MSGWPSRRRSHETRTRARRMVVVLVGLAVATMIFLSVLKLIAVQRQSVELQTRQIQAGWLAESAVQRACARLSAEANYRGETWNISAQDTRRTRRRHDRNPRGRRPRQARSPRRPRRGRLPGRSLPTGPAGPRGDRSKSHHRTNSPERVQSRIRTDREILACYNFQFETVSALPAYAVLRSSNCWSSSPSSAC